MKHHLAAVTLIALIGLTACQRSEQADAAAAADDKLDPGFLAEIAAREAARRPLDPETVVRVALFRDGRVEVDGAPTEAEQIATKMKSAADSKKSVVYYREDAEYGLSPQQKGAMPAILGAVAENLLPIRFSLNADFSDTVVDKGISRTP